MIFPPRDICPDCAVKNQAQTPYHFSGKGEIYSYTTIFESTNAPEGFEGQTPYTVALVRLIEEDAGGERIEGPLVTAMLSDLDISLPVGEKIKIGQPVEMVTRKLREDGERGMLVYGYKFRPVLEPRPDFSLDEVLRLAAACVADPKNLDLGQAYEDKFRPLIHKIT